MDDVRVYSLADHTVHLKTADGYEVKIGNGQSVETITVTFANDNVSFTMSNDGTSTMNVNKMLNGTASIALNQANPFVDKLINFYKHQLFGGVIRPATMVISDTYGNINGKFEKCAITKIPDYTAGSESQSREFVIAYGKGTM